MNNNKLGKIRSKHVEHLIPTTKKQTNTKTNPKSVVRARLAKGINVK